MKEVYRFEVPAIPPSVNSIYGVGEGKMYKKKNVAEFEKVCSYYMPRNPVPITEYCFLEVIYLMKDGTKFDKSDTDNFLKVTQDMLQSFEFVKNDNLILDVYARRRISDREATIGCLYLLEESDFE